MDECDCKEIKGLSEDEAELQRLLNGFKFETDEELKRKREVFRSHVVSQTIEKIKENSKKLEFNQKAYDVLSKIIQQREIHRIRREWLSEASQWLGLLITFSTGVWAHPHLQKIWNAIENLQNK